MTPRLPRITAVQLERALRRDGWYFVRQAGSHAIMKHPTKPGFVVLPKHPGDIATGTIKDILGPAGLTADQLRELM